MTVVAETKVEPSQRWVRGVSGTDTVVDSKNAKLFWAPKAHGPVYAFPEQEVRADALASGAVSKPEAAELAGHVVVDWNALEHWYEEDEEVFVGARDPYWRVDAIRSTRRVRVEIDGRVVAETEHPVVVFESHLQVRYYLPPEDVDFSVLTATETRTGCPYKGYASYWSYTGGDGPDVPDLAWGYAEPLGPVAAIKDYVSFYGPAVTVLVDGAQVPA
jgi:uncharacterized protein (DUF427 family)